MNVFAQLLTFFRRLFGSAPATPKATFPEPPHYATRYGLEVAFKYNIAPPDLSDLKPKIVRMDTSTYPGSNDTFLDAMKAQKIDVILITPYNYLSNPRTADDAGIQMGIYAQRNRGKVWGYEVMNEPNAPAGSNGGSRFFAPGEYISYLSAISTALRRFDPATPVILGGTSGYALEWHRELARLGAAMFVDYVAFHPYGGEPSTVHDRVAELAHVWGKPLICTEYGDPDPAKMIAMHKALDGLVHTSIIFTWHSIDASDPYGLLDHTGAKRTSYESAKLLLAK